MYALKNCTIFTGEGVLENSAVIVDGRRITEIIAVSDVAKGMEVRDLKGSILAPGFIDLQLNGCGGRMFNDDISVETLDVMAEAILPTGCTSFLPTLVSTNDEAMLQALKVVRNYRAGNGSAILGLHLEGPYLSLKRRGIHDPDEIRDPDERMLEIIVEYGSEVTRICTMAPETVKPEHVEKLTRAGIVVSAGHSAAPCPQARTMFRSGMTMATHLFNGMEPLQGREPSLVGAIYLEKPWTGIIADGVHVSWDNIELAKNILREKAFCITDAVSAVGTDMTEFQLGGQTVFVKDGKCSAADGTIGGSVLSMDQAVRNCVDHVGIDLYETLRMATLYPAKAIDIDSEYGRVTQGYMANLVVLDKESLSVRHVVRDGKVYRI